MEAEDDGRGPVPMEVGAMKGKKGDKGKKGYGKGKYGKSFGKYDKSNESARTTIAAKETRKERKAKEMERKRREASAKLEFPGLLQVMWQMECTRRMSVGKGTCKPWKKFRVLLRVQWRRAQRPHLRLRRQQRLFKSSMMSMNQDGSSV